MTAKCELCKCLNLVTEGRKHPSQTIWYTLTRKFEAIRERDQKAIESLCEQHRRPLTLTSDVQSVGDFIEKVFAHMDRFYRELYR